MKKNIIIVLFVLIGLFGLMWWGKSIQRPVPDPSKQTGGAKSALTAAETFYDFGKISMADGKVDKIFKINNPRDKDMTLKNLTTSCMCTSAYIMKSDGQAKGPFQMAGMGGNVPLANEIIRAGESLDIKVVYNPNAHGPAGVGPIDRFIYLVDSEGGSLNLEIKALVTP